MGIRQSTALEITVYENDHHKRTYNFTMKQVRTFQNIGDALNLMNLDLNPKDKIYLSSNTGLKEIHADARITVQDLPIKKWS
jgi:hypothetical protein